MAKNSAPAPPVPSGKQPGSGEIRVAVAARPPLFAEVLCRALAREPGITIVGHAQTVEDVAILHARSCVQVLLFDYEGLGPNSESAIERLRRADSGRRILVISSRSGGETVGKVLRAGASGLVGKDSELATLVRAIRSVAAGELWADRVIAAQTIERLAGISQPMRHFNDILTRRETQIVGEIARGLRNKEIGRRMGISEKTVKSHLNNIFRKLEVDNRVALGLYGLGQIQPKS
ncbi:MAG: response regulator transcription factor [Acidobacteriota bacterium]